MTMTVGSLAGFHTQDLSSLADRSSLVGGLDCATGDRP
jgi:hypothetical protein